VPLPCAWRRSVRLRRQRGVDSGSRFGPADTVGSSRVPIEATVASLKLVMEQVSKLVLAAKDAVGELRIAHVDVALVIATDGSVGLLGTAVDAGAKATLTVRL
jgi:hypothetical protein